MKILKTIAHLQNSIFLMNDIVPTHYNINGDIDRWGSKYENFIFPAIIIAFYLFWIIYIKLK